MQEGPRGCGGSRGVWEWTKFCVRGSTACIVDRSEIALVGEGRRGD